jgi:phosphate transport system substrate-binding protein
MKRLSFFRLCPLVSLYATIAAIAALLLAGCGGGAGGGTVRVDGSSTVFPITEAVSEKFQEKNRRARVTVGVSGTGGGFSKFVRGETDVNDASRPITAQELQKAKKNNIRFIELPVAYDGLAVVTNTKNDWLQCLKTEELRQIWKPGSNVDTWSDVRDSFPDRPVKLYGSGTASGTYDYFTEAVMGEADASRTDFTASEDDNVLVQGIQGDPGALGFFGLSYYLNNQEQLKLIEIDNGDGCVKPSEKTVRTGKYQPLSRPLFIYVRRKSARDSVVQAFTNFYLENAGDLAQQVGYVPLQQNEYKLVKQRFENRTTGSMFGGKGAKVGVSLETLLKGGSSASDSTAAAPADTASSS